MKRADADHFRTGRLLFELGHPLKLAVGRGGAEDPGELGVLGHVALDEHRADRRVDPDR